MTLIDKYNQEIQHLCSKHKVKRLFAFGSVINDGFNNSSDIDLIVDFEPIDINSYADNYFDFKFALEDTFLRPVDLLEEKAINNPYFKEAVQNQRQLIYGY